MGATTRSAGQALLAEQEIVIAVLQLNQSIMTCFGAY